MTQEWPQAMFRAASNVGDPPSPTAQALLGKAGEVVCLSRVLADDPDVITIASLLDARPHLALIAILLGGATQGMFREDDVTWFLNVSAERLGKSRVEPELVERLLDRAHVRVRKM